MNKKQLAGDALSKALHLRRKMNIQLHESIDSIDIAERIGIEVRMVDIPSMEGIYAPGSRAQILLSTLRPSGRRNFTCAHEIGHHTFGHGEMFDEIRSESEVSRKNDPNEFIADCFASYFLMPKTTVESGINARNINLRLITPNEIYGLSNWLNVGYTTLIGHMHHSLQILDSLQATTLSKIEPKSIRAEIYEPSSRTNLHIFDEFWQGRALDCEVGEYIKVPDGTIVEGYNLEIEYETADFKILRVTEPGIGKVSIAEKNAAFVRASKFQYVGLSQYRHEEEIE